MTTLYDIGDEVEIKMVGKIKSYSASKEGDCYVIELTNVSPEGTKVYLDTPSLINSRIINVEDEK